MLLSVPFVAGIIDSRGHIRIESRRPGELSPRIRVTTRRHELLAHLAQVTGTKVIRDLRPYERRPCGTHCQERHQHMVRQSNFWNADGSRATIILWNIRPYIVSQVSEVRTALLTGLDVWPPQRGDTLKRMAELGWEVPDATLPDAMGDTV